MVVQGLVSLAAWHGYGGPKISISKEIIRSDMALRGQASDGRTSTPSESTRPLSTLCEGTRR
jgi:hypothetical protein